MTYDEAVRQIISTLETTKFGVLATANQNGIVAASQMCIINDGTTVYCQTDKNFEKIKNISENPNVAINLGAFYFKGVAQIMGHPSVFPEFIEKIKAKHLNTYENYTNLPNEVLIKIELTECKIWGTDKNKDIHNQETIVVVDLQNQTINQITCDKM